jgi:hypothetical protein
MKKHAKQVAAWGKLLGLCHDLGGSFNPSKESMKGTALECLLNESQKSVEAVHIAESAVTHAVNTRDHYIRQLPKISSRIVGALEAIDTPVDILNDVNRLRKRLSYQPPPKKGATATKSIPGGQTGIAGTADSSTTVHGKLQQLDIESKIDNFALLIQTLRGVPDYNTEEPGITINDLVNFQQELKSVHQGAIDASATFKKARTVRDNLLYGATGVHGRSKMVKGYFRSKFGFTSPEFEAVRKIEFTKNTR